MSKTGQSIVILTEYFYPEEASTAQLLTDLAIGLNGGFDISVITSHPNYLYSDKNLDVASIECYDDVTIRRVRGTRLDKGRFIYRAVNWVTFSLLAFLRLVRLSDRGDAILVVSNPPILPMAVLAASRLQGFDYAYLIHDMYPDMPIGLGMLSEDGIIARGWERAIRAVYCDADRIVVLGDSMNRRLSEKMRGDPDFDPEKITVIPNWVDGEFIEPLPKEDNPFAREHDLLEGFVLVYSGNIGQYHELRTAIEAIGELEDRGVTDVELLVIGEGARKAEHRRYVSREGIENVRFLPFQPRERLPETLTACDASLVGIEPSMEGICVSSKLYTSLAAGKPVFAVVAENDEVARVVRSDDCGAYIEPGDVEHAADVLEKWADDPEEVERLGRNARESFEANYRKEHAIEAYTSLFESMNHDE